MKFKKNKMNRKNSKQFSNCIGVCVRCSETLECNPANPLYQSRTSKKPNFFSTHSVYFTNFLQRLKKKLGFLGRFANKYHKSLRNIRVGIYLKQQYFKRRLKKIYIKLRGKNYARQLECNPNKFEH